MINSSSTKSLNEQEIDFSKIKSPTPEEIELTRIDVVSYILEKEIRRLQSKNSLYEDFLETRLREEYISDLNKAIELWEFWKEKQR